MIGQVKIAPFSSSLKYLTWSEASLGLVFWFVPEHKLTMERTCRLQNFIPCVVLIIQGRSFHFKSFCCIKKEFPLSISPVISLRDQLRIDRTDCFFCKHRIYANISFCFPLHFTYFGECWILFESVFGFSWPVVKHSGGFVPVPHLNLFRTLALMCLFFIYKNK